MFEHIFTAPDGAFDEECDRTADGVSASHDGRSNDWDERRGIRVLLLRLAGGNCPFELPAFTQRGT